MTANCLDNTSSFCSPARQFFSLLQSQLLRFTQLVLTMRETLEPRSRLCYLPRRQAPCTCLILWSTSSPVEIEDYQVQSFSCSQIKEGGMKLSICFSLWSILRQDKQACQKRKQETDRFSKAIWEPIFKSYFQICPATNTLVIFKHRTWNSWKFCPIQQREGERSKRRWLRGRCSQGRVEGILFFFFILGACQKPCEADSTPAEVCKRSLAG